MDDIIYSKTTILGLNKKDLTAVKRLNDKKGGRMLPFINEVLDDACHDRECYLAKIDDKVVGWLLVESSSIKTFYLIDVYVAKPHRKKGIGKGLLKKCIAAAKRLKKPVYGFYTVSSSELYKKMKIKNGLAVS